MAYSELRLDTAGFTQGGEEGVSIAAHHSSKLLNGNPIPAEKFKKLGNLLVVIRFMGKRFAAM